MRPVAAARAEFKRLASTLAGSEPISTRILPGGSGPGREVAEVGYEGGITLIRKRGPLIEMKKEYCGSLVSDAFEAGAPPVYYRGEEIYMPKAKGRPVDQRSAIARIANTEQGLRIGLTDHSTYVFDRTSEPGNLLISLNEAGIEEPTPVDFGSAKFEINDLSDPHGPAHYDPFQRGLPDRLVGAFSAQQWDTFRANLDSCEPEFARLGEPQWHRVTTANFDTMREQVGWREASQVFRSSQFYQQIQGAPRQERNQAGEAAPRGRRGRFGLGWPNGRTGGKDRPGREKRPHQQNPPGQQPGGRHR